MKIRYKLLGYAIREHREQYKEKLESENITQNEFEKIVFYLMSEEMRLVPFLKTNKIEKAKEILGKAGLVTKIIVT